MIKGISIIYVNSEICARSLVYTYIHIQPRGFVTNVLVYIWSSELQLEYKFCDTQCSILMTSLNSMNCLKLTKPRKLTLFLISLFYRLLTLATDLGIVSSSLYYRTCWYSYFGFDMACIGWTVE